MDFQTTLQAIFTENGIFAGLAVGLIIWQSKTNQDREGRYITIINSITDKIADKITKVENDVEDIKGLIKGDKNNGN